MGSMGDALLFEVGLDTRRVDSGLKQIEGRARDASGRFTKGFREANDEIDGMGSGLGSVSGMLGKAAASLGGLLAGLGAARAVGGFLGSVIGTGQEFEAAEARLATLLGSAGAAQQRMQELFSIASSTPFELGELVEADVQLEAFGASAEEWRGAVMDLAGAMGMDLTEAASAVGRAFTGGAGAADILRERGVLAMVELRSGVRAADMTVEEFRKELLATLTDPNGKFAGGAARLAKTFGGLVSNLQDSWTGFTKQVADATFFDSARAAVAEILDIMGENRAEVSAVAQEIGTGLTAALSMAAGGVGILVDGFDMVRASIAGWELGARAAYSAILSGLADLIEGIETANARLGNPLGLSQQLSSAWTSVAGASNEAALAFDTAREAAEPLFDGLGRGAEFAERIRKAMEMGQGQGIGSALGGAAGAGAPPGASGGASAGGPTSAVIGPDQVEILTIQEEALVRIIDLEEERAEAQRKQLETVSRQQSALSALGDLMGDISQLGSIMANGMADSNIKAAQAMFDVFRAFGAAQIIIETSVGLARAAAQPPPFNALMAAQVLVGAGIAGARLATAKRPTAHMGDVIERAAPDETDRRLKLGEGVLNTAGVAAMGGPDAVRQANRGMTPAAERIIAVNSLEHRMFGAFVARDVDLPESQLGAIRREARGRVGHRNRRTG